MKSPYAAKLGPALQPRVGYFTSKDERQGKVKQVRETHFSLGTYKS